jgi:hypothetical protein
MEPEKPIQSETTYKISNSREGYCTCGHTGAAHGSNGFICCACDCKKFEQVTNEANVSPIDWTPQTPYKVGDTVVINGMTVTIVDSGIVRNSSLTRE